MSIKRLTHRVSSAQKIAVAELTGHELAFRKKGNIDGSAKCDIALTENESAIVMGIIFKIADEQLSDLDRIEGVGFGYEAKEVAIRDSNGNWINAKTYYATAISDNLKPFHWYKHHVVVGCSFTITRTSSS